jgi:type I restriction enzyme S subunit
MNNWKPYNLEQLAYYYNGMAFKPDDWKEDGIKIIRIEQLNNPTGHYDYYQGEVSENNEINNEDLIFSWSATLKVAIWKHGYGVLNQHLFKVVPREIADKYFLYYLLDANMDKLGESSHGLTMKHIKRGELEKYIVLIPDKTEQQRIARILSTADAVIEKTQAAIAKYKAIKQGMLHDLFTRGIDLNTGKLRPRYQDAPHLYKESKLGMIPREWEVKELQAVGDVLSGATPSTEIKEFWDGEITWITPADLSRQTDLIYFTKSFRKITEEGLQGCSAVLVPENSLVISSRAPIGYLSIVLHPFTTNQGCKSIRFFSNQVPEFFYYNLLCNVERLKGMGAGTTFAEISKSDLDFFEVVFCEEPEQIEIANRLKAVDMAIQTEQTYLQKMQSLKKGLMEDLLSGKKSLNL